MNKKSELRKNAILDATEELIALYGVDNTGTNAILQKVGIARGTLYHHFQSKQEIIDALILRRIDHLLEKAKKIASDQTIPVYERLFATIGALNMGENELLSYLHRPENSLIHQKTQQILMQKVPPLLLSILEEGQANHLIQTKYPLEAIEMLLLYAQFAFAPNIPQAEQENKEKALLYQMERLLGIEENSLLPFLQNP